MKEAEALLGLAFGIIMMLMLALLGFLVAGVGSYLWDDHRFLFIGGVGGLAVVLLLLIRRPSVPSRIAASASSRQEVHPGIRVHAIPVAGGVGSVFLLGFLVMFWFGVPGYRPLVLLAAALGVVAGVALILRRKWTS
jgi:hypothetical protein